MGEPAKTPPPGQPKEPGKRSRMLFWLGCTGCLFGLILLGVGGTMAYLFFKEARARQENPLPAGWRDSLRVAYRLPDAIARVVPPGSAAAEDLAEAAAVPADSVRRGRVNLSMRLSRGVALQPADEAVMTATLSDTVLDRVASMARFGSYDVLRRLAEGNVVTVARNTRNAGIRAQGERIARGAAGLVVRGEARLRRGDVARARDDFRAVLALGAAMWRTEPTLMDLVQARRLLDAGTEGLSRVAARTRDSALARETTEMRDWLKRRTRLWYFLGQETDTLLVVAADTLLPRGIRIESIQGVAGSSLFSFPRIVMGPSAGAVRGVRALQADRDPVVVRAAVIADSTLAQLDDMGIRGRWRLVTRGFRR